MKRKFFTHLLRSAILLPAAFVCSCGPKNTAVTPTSPEVSSATAPTASSNEKEEPNKLSVLLKKPEPIKQGLTRHPYVQLATQTSIQVIWRQQIATAPTVKYGTSPGSLTQSVPKEKLVVRSTAKDDPNVDPKLALHSAPTKTKQFEATIEGLEPDTKYFYAVEDAGVTLAGGLDHYFRTQPKVGSTQPLTIWVAGDGGTGGRTQAQVHSAAVEWVKKTGKELDLFLHVGDMAYNSGLDSEFQGRFFEMYSPTTRNTVCWAAMGNHEGKTSKGQTGVGPYYDAYATPTRGEAGGTPSGREAYYSFDHGNIHFVVLDSCNEGMKKSGELTSLGNEMMTWLKEDLEKAKSDWLIAFFHHPPYTKGSHDSDKQKDYESIVMRNKFMPLLESAGVDMVLSGHSHIYERSMLINGATHTPSKAEGVIFDDGDGPYTKSKGLNGGEGTIYVVTGNAGTSLKRVGTIPFMKKIILEHGSVMIQVEGDKLRSVMVNKDGKESDVYEIHKAGKLAPRQALTTFAAAPLMPKQTSVRAEGLPTSEPEKSSSGSSKEKIVEMPAEYAEIIPGDSEWRYHVGDFVTNWTKPGFDDKDWDTGKAGIGYGDDDDETDVEDEMQDNFLSLYMRKEFELTPDMDLNKLGLGIRVDDGFIAYVNGVEVARKNVEGWGTTAKCPKAHEASKTRFEYFSLKAHAAAFRRGSNIFAIQCVNDDKDSSDLTAAPIVITEK